MSIKAIYFDLGGVVLNMDRLIDHFLDIFRPEDTKKFCGDINLKSFPMTRGEITDYQFWKMLADQYGKTIPNNVLRELWTAKYEELTYPNEDVLEMVQLLRNQYKIGLLSNTYDKHSEINRRRGLFNSFDVLVLSHELGITKEDEDIFRIAARNIDAEPGECIFVDDVEEFVNTAKSAGMKGILFRNVLQLKRDLKGYL